MKHYQLESKTDGSVLFEGHFQNFKNCLEQAVQDRVTLDGVLLRNKNLSNITLDDAIMPNADFCGCNLSGANISEAYLKGANFDACALYNVCFVHSNLTACNFTNATFGGTDIHGAILTHAQFSTLSCFGLDFTHVRNMSGCIFINPDGRICSMSRPPIVIRGLEYEPVIVLDHHIKIGHRIADPKQFYLLIEKLSTRTRRRRLTA